MTVTAHKGVRGLTLSAGVSSGIILTDCEDMTIEAMAINGPGLVDGVPGEGYGISLTRCKKVTIRRCKIAGFKVGIVVYLTDGFEISGCDFSKMRADGIDVAQSWNGAISDCTFRDTRIVADEHPDAIQLWSRPTAPPTSDIRIVGNRIMGEMQGIGCFNHVRNGIDDGGFDRITISENVIEVSYPQAISLMAGRSSVVRNNTVRTLTGSKSRASINTGLGVHRFGNTVFAGAGKAAVID